MRQTTTSAQSAQNISNATTGQTFRFELYSTPTKRIENPRCGLTFYGINEAAAIGMALGMVIGLKEKYQAPRVLLYRQNPNEAETLIREQR